MQVSQTLYMLDYVGPPGFAKAAAESGARCSVLNAWSSGIVHRTAANQITSYSG